jgi:hypothetical protein
MNFYPIILSALQEQHIRTRDAAVRVAREAVMVPNGSVFVASRNATCNDIATAIEKLERE